MKKTVLGMAAAALLFAGCSKEELVEEAIPSEGVNAIATNSNGAKNASTDEAEIWFQENQGRMMMRLGGPIGTLPTDCRPKGRISFRASSNPDDHNSTEASLCRLGNSRNYRSANNTFNFNEEDYFSLVDFRVDWNATDDTPQEVSGSLFLYPSGRTVAQNPKPVKGLIGGWTFDDGAAQDQSRMLTITIVDDPGQEISSVKFTSEDGSSYLEQTHFNQSLGLSRWSGPGRGGAGGSGIFGGEAYMLSSDSYEVDFLDESNNAVILAKYGIRVPVVWHVLHESSQKVQVEIEENDNPVFLGTALRSKTGETWTYEVALADVGDWVESATLAFPEQEGVFPTQSEFDMQLVRSEGNLKVFRTEGILFEGLEPGTDVQALVSAFGRGNRGAANSADNRAELL